MLYYADWYHDTEQAELIEVPDEGTPVYPLEECGATPLEAWRKLAVRQLLKAGEVGQKFTDIEFAATHHEMVKASIAVEYYFRSWTEEIERVSEGPPQPRPPMLDDDKAGVD